MIDINKNELQSAFGTGVERNEISDVLASPTMGLNDTFNTNWIRWMKFRALLDLNVKSSSQANKSSNNFLYHSF
jgi:hypothetical protein